MGEPRRRIEGRRSSAAARLALVALAAMAAAGACREPMPPFEAAMPEPDDDLDVWRLTFSSRDDRAPAWSAAGDSVYYVAEGFDHLPRTPGVVVGLPYRGGVARPILDGVQDHGGSRRWLATPVAAPDGSRLAYADFVLVWPATVCPGAIVCDPASAPSTGRQLGAVTLRVRAFDAVGPIGDDPAMTIAFAGRGVQDDVTPAIIDIVYHPFQVLWDRARTFAFRPSWSPDARRIVTSDGLRLLIWDLDDDTVEPIPGTEDAVTPAWSPDGEWIAFTRLERADSSASTCTHLGGLGPICEQRRTTYAIGRRVLSLVRPDGSALAEIGTGEEPAWAPDGRALYVHRADAIWRVARFGGGAAPVPGTEGGREPAVSADGRFLAFARRSTGSPGDPAAHDIWVVALPETP